MNLFSKHVKKYFWKRRGSRFVNRIAVFGPLLLAFCGYLGLPANGRRTDRRLNQKKNQCTLAIFQLLQPHTVARHSRPLLPDTKLAENRIEQVFRRRFANDFTDGIDRNAQIHRHQFECRVRAQCLERSQYARAGAVQRVLMP